MILVVTRQLRNDLYRTLSDRVLYNKPMLISREFVMRPELDHQKQEIRK
jgi:hypothetical protein